MVAGRTTAVLLAGGIGRQVGSQLPQLVEVAGRPIMHYTLAVFDAHPDIDDIVIVMAQGYGEVARSIVHSGGHQKARQILEGGESRSHSSLRGLNAIPSEGDGKVLTHDAIRPFVSPRIISDCVQALDSDGAVDVVIPPTDSIIEISQGNSLRRALPHSTVRLGQTPQAFRLSVIKEAYARATADPEFKPTDDCTVVQRYMPEVPIRVVAGEELNTQVTEPIDVYLVEKLLELAERDIVRPRRDDEGTRRLE